MDEEAKKILREIQAQQVAMNEKLDRHTKVLDRHTEILEGHTKVLKDHTGRLGALAGDMEQVLVEVKATHDEIGLWHQRDKREIDELKKHSGLPLISDIPA